MKNSEVRFLRIKMQHASNADNGNIHHIPLESILEIKKAPSTGDSAVGTITIKYNAGSAVTISCTSNDAGTQAQNNAIIDALETELINCIEALVNGSKNIVTVPWSEGNCLTGTLNAGEEGTAAKTIITTGTP